MENSGTSSSRYSSSSSGRSGKAGGRGRGSSRDTLLAAVALQDHIARTMRMGAVPKKNLKPSIEPGEPMTLAQSLGLIPRPPPLLTESEWDEVHLKARLRQDDKEECPICQERFKNDTQVLLSCSHVYHKQCLASYERYARTRACPLCRAQQYQRLEIHDGAEAYRRSCATLIQSHFRGHLARRRYKELRRHNPPKYSEALRRRWAAERLDEESSKLIEEMEEERGDLDDLFRELDAGLQASRDASDAVDRTHAAAIYSRLEQQEEEEERWRFRGDSPDLIETLEEGGRQRMESEEAAGPSNQSIREDSVHASSYDPIRPGTSGGNGEAAASVNMSCSISVGGKVGPDGVDWPSVLVQGKQRGEDTCPICIGNLGRRGNGGVAWLSCSHAFHTPCIRAFEAFELANKSTPSCPVCRLSGYQRRCFDTSSRPDESPGGFEA